MVKNIGKFLTGASTSFLKTNTFSITGTLRTTANLRKGREEQGWYSITINWDLSALLIFKLILTLLVSQLTELTILIQAFVLELISLSFFTLKLWLPLDEMIVLFIENLFGVPLPLSISGVSAWLKLDMAVIRKISKQRPSTIMLVEVSFSTHLAMQL